MKYFPNYSYYLANGTQGVGAFVQDIPAFQLERFYEFCKENAIAIVQSYPYMIEEPEPKYFEFIISEITDEQAVLLRLSFE